MTFLRGLLDKYFPIKCKTIPRKRIETPWITSDIRKCITRKHRWFRMAKSNIITLYSYKKYCKALRYLLRVSRSDYYANKLYSLGNNVQKNWKVLNKLMNKGNKGLSERFIIENVSCTNKQRIANEFNNYFLNHPKSIQNNLAI